MKILIVAAHPDDEVLGCGGTIAKLSRRHDVRIAILGEGLTSRSSASVDAESAAALAQLQDDARAVSKMLGASSVVFGGLPDNRFDELPLLSVVKRVEAWIGETSPEVIYTHHAGDLNIDHAITCRAVMTATRPLPGCPVRDVYSFEVPSSTEWTFQRLEPVFRPNVFVDITATIELKVEAMQRYASETRPFPHPRSPEALRAYARRWGSVVGVDGAEAFELLRAIR